MQRCPHCNEVLEDGAIPICWHCGREPRVDAAPPSLQEMTAQPAQNAPPDVPAAQMAAAAQLEQLWHRWKLPVMGLAAVVAVVAVLSIMSRPAADIAAGASAAAPADAPPAHELAPAVVEVEEAPAWIVPRAVGYASDGSRTITLQLDALRDVRVRSERIRPVLAVRCLSRQTEVFVAVGTATKPEAGDEHTVTIQFDEESPVTERWVGSATYRELFAPDGLAVARRLAAARVWQFTYTPYNSRPVVAQFSVQGLNQHIGTVARACGWPTAEGAAARK